jgi:hypothetical protein
LTSQHLVAHYLCIPSIRKTPSGNYELKVASKLLPEIYYDTFSSREEAHAYGDRLATLLRQGIVPPELLEKKSGPKSWTISRCIAEYVKTGKVKDSEMRILETI